MQVPVMDMKNSRLLVYTSIQFYVDELGIKAVDSM